MPKHAHKLIAKTAREMAEAVYEGYMHDNRIYAHWKRVCPELTPRLARKKFVELLYPQMIEEARQILAQMLGSTSSSVTEHMKREIAEALILDNELRLGRAEGHATGTPKFLLTETIQ